MTLCVCSGHSYPNCAVVVLCSLVSVTNMVLELVLVSQPCPTTSNAQNHEGKELGVSAPSGYKVTSWHNWHHCTSNCLCSGFFLVAVRYNFTPAWVSLGLLFVFSFFGHQLEVNGQMDESLVTHHLPPTHLT